MKYLLDTDTLSFLLRRSPPPALVRRVARVEARDQCTSAITLGELLYGAIRLGGTGDRLRGRIEEEVIANLPVVGFDSTAARAYAEIRVSLEAQGAPIGDADMRIAAIARSRNLTVVTSNTRHFARVEGLTVEDWTEADRG